MEFCIKCGKPMKTGKEIAICSCGFVKQVNPTSFNETLKKPIEKGEGIAEEKKELKGFPDTCKKCGHEFADVTDLGVFYSDEASIHLYKCKKCGNVKRESYGSSNG